MAKRIYLTEDSTGTKRLTKTTMPSQAVAHHARSLIKVRVATQDDLVELLQAGTQVEEPGTAAEPDEAQ